MRKFKERKKRAAQITRELKRLFSDASTDLNYSNNEQSSWELLVAVILSAQCTDEMVNKVTEKLFKKYRTLDDYIDANPAEFEQDIKPTGYYKNKTKNILAAAKIIKEEYGGEVPDTMEELLKIPGVGRKTANVVLGNAFGKVEGMAVDTHVRRFTIRFDLTDNTDPNKIEEDLMKLLPRDAWFSTTHRLVEYGQKICPARKHDCTGHPLTKIYPPAAKIWPKAK